MNGYITIDSEKLSHLCDKVLENIEINIEKKKLTFINNKLEKDRKGWFGKVKTIDEDALTKSYTRYWQLEYGNIVYLSLKNDIRELKAACKYAESVNVNVDAIEIIDRWVTP